MNFEQRTIAGKEGEVFACRWLVENKKSIFPALGVDLDCEVYLILKESDKNKPLPDDIKVFVRDVVQYYLGIDIVIGKFISKNLFECQLTIDTKNYFTPYFELYGNQYYRHSFKTGGKRINLARKSLSMRYNTCVDNAEDFDWGSDYANSKLKTAMNNSYALAHLFVQPNKTVPVVGSEFTSMPIILTEDLLGGLRSGCITGGKFTCPRDDRKLSKHIHPLSYHVFGGVHVHLQFDDADVFFTQLDKYKESCIKESKENKSAIRIIEDITFDTVDVNDSIKIKIPVGKHRVLVEFDEVGQELKRVMIDEKEIEFAFIDENTDHIPKDENWRDYN